MTQWLASVALIVLCLTASGSSGRSKPDQPSPPPHSVRVGLWSLHPPQELKVNAEGTGARASKCKSCSATEIKNLVVHAGSSSVVVSGDLSATTQQLQVSGAYTISASGLPPVRADFPIEIHSDGGRLRLIAVMPIDEYVAGVLAGETGTFQSDEALKAMSVAARTFAIHFGSRHAVDGFDFCDNTHCQNLRFSDANNRFRQIAESTAGEISWYEGEPAATYYFANCGGRTEDGSYMLGNDEPPAPYLKQHSDQYCVRSAGAQWSSDVLKGELREALIADGIAVPGKLRTISIANRTASGRVELVRIVADRTVMVPGVAFRAAIGRHIGWERLKSNWYEVADHGDELRFHGRGLGHGVGLCQVGAEVMGEEGHSYQQILAFYYPGTHLGISAQGTPWRQLANDDIDLLTTHPERDRALLPVATRLLHRAEEDTGLMYRAKPRLKVYATTADFRNASGEPGWVAASTRGRTIQLQPPEVLNRTGSLDQTIHHELLHILIESYAHPGTPRWFREGLVLYLAKSGDGAEKRAYSGDVKGLEVSLRMPASEEELRRAYAEARARVTALAQQHNAATLLDWLQNGLPPELASSGAP